jgi:hypothetical protein
MSRPPLKERLHRSEPDDAALERVWSGVREKERQRSRPVLGLSIAAAATVVGLFVFLRPDAPPLSLQPAPGSLVQLGRGSSVQLGPDAQFETAPQLALRAGRAQFTLEPAASPWQVSSRHLHLEVAAATFTLEVGGEIDSISVTRGAVRLSTPGASEGVVLSAGQSFSTGAPPPPSWEALAREGNLAGAWALLQHDGVLGQVAGAPAEKTMLLSDVAAAGGDEALSRELLRVVVDASDGGAERGLAAYTLGVRLQTDGQLEDAAKAFEQSVELGLPPELRREAHMRAAQSWRGAGEPERAKRVQERAPPQ